MVITFPVVIFALAITFLLLFKFVFKEIKQQAQNINSSQFSTKDWIRLGLSVTILAVSLFIILSGNYAEAEQRWAFASIGTILGYWLR